MSTRQLQSPSTHTVIQIHICSVTFPPLQPLFCHFGSSCSPSERDTERPRENLSPLSTVTVAKNINPATLTFYLPNSSIHQLIISFFDSFGPSVSPSFFLLNHLLLFGNNSKYNSKLPLINGTRWNPQPS